MKVGSVGPNKFTMLANLKNPAVIVIMKVGKRVIPTIINIAMLITDALFRYGPHPEEDWLVLSSLL